MLAVIVILALCVWAAVNLSAAKDCEAQGKFYARGVWGFECVNR